MSNTEGGKEVHYKYVEYGGGEAHFDNADDLVVYLTQIANTRGDTINNFIAFPDTARYAMNRVPISILKVEKTVSTTETKLA